MLREPTVAKAKVRLNKIHIRGYRSCKSTQFDLNRELSVLIGRNGSGKTNVLQGALLLSSTPRRRIGPSDVDGSSLRSVVEAEFSIGKRQVNYRGTIRHTTDDRNRDRVLTTDEQWGLTAFGVKEKWTIVPWRSAHSRQRFLNLQRVHSYLSNKELDALEKPIPPEAIEAIQEIDKFRASMRYFSASQFTNPSGCPSSFEIDEDGDLREQFSAALTGTLGTHTRFLYDLYRAYKEDTDAYAAFLSLAGKQGIGLIDKIAWKEVKISSGGYEVRSGATLVKTETRTRQMIVPRVYVNKTQLSFNQLSEGTLKTLALLFYLLTSEEKILLIEEPEICVHHGLLSSVLEVVKNVSRRKQIVLSTHSNFVLDLLTPEDVFIVSNTLETGTVVDRISESLSAKDFAALKIYLEHSGNLGEYWAQGGLN